MDKPIAHFFLTKLLLLLLLLVTLPAWLPAVLLADSFENHGKYTILVWGIRLTLLLFLIGMYWLSKRMSHYMTLEGLTFRKGVRAGFQDARLYLSFVPLVGCWFDDNRDPHDDDST
jgi:hypothetical protein